MITGMSFEEPFGRGGEQGPPSFRPPSFPSFFLPVPRLPLHSARPFSSIPLEVGPPLPSFRRPLIPPLPSPPRSSYSPPFPFLPSSKT